ncbi:SufS family cysteine desulfurase [Acholeplasma sp. OttesenSCG-928-E16]|nr:SufS family cysteine desulfurase [Acholeplasma sp. OttesenSCG-928-E16]
MLNVNKIRKRFPIYKNNKDLVYLDSAATALKLDSVIDQEVYYYKNISANVHRGVYKNSYQATFLYEEARSKIANFINAKEEEVIFTKGTTDSLNKVARMLEDSILEGDEIITSELEHHSSILPWMEIANKKKAKLVFIPLTKDNKITLNNFKKVLSSKSKVVAITHMSNVLGDLVDAKEIFSLAKDKNMYTILDCAQSIMHTKINVKELKCDFLGFSGHKMFGPTGIGILFGKEELLNNLPPAEFGGEMVNQVFKNHATYKDAPLRLEAGTQNIAGAIGLAAAIDFIDEIGYENINKHIKFLRKYAINQMMNIDGITIYNQKSNGAMISFNVDGLHPHDSATYLDQENVAVRAGHHCAQLVNNLLSVDATLRVSLSIYNNKKDIDLFIDALKKTINFFNGF